MVVVAGATGRLGSKVVAQLLSPDPGSKMQPVRVRALVRSKAKAEGKLPVSSPLLEVMECNLLDNNSVVQACAGAEAAVWCATGFSDSSERSVLDKLLGAVRQQFRRQESVDIAGIKSVAACFRGGASALGGPRVVLCSSAGVTRTTWSEAKKKQYEGCADIPIVRVNPLGVLDTKRESEEVLRASGADYTVVRPCGLNDAWPQGRPLLSQGDMAVGRISRQDAARVLAEMLFEPLASGKTFEVFALSGYDKPADNSQQLARLRTDSEEASSPTSDASLSLLYSLLQQLVPGKELAPNKLAMGQTYEQLDNGERGRLGERGRERPQFEKTE